MTPEQLLEDYGLRTPDLDEQRAREAEEQWHEHLDKCAYEEWGAEQLELRKPGRSKHWNSVPREQPAQRRQIFPKGRGHRKSGGHTAESTLPGRREKRASGPERADRS